jgi:hypothetical protein
MTTLAKRKQSHTIVSMRIIAFRDRSFALIIVIERMQPYVTVHLLKDLGIFNKITVAYALTSKLYMNRFRHCPK